MAVDNDLDIGDFITGSLCLQANTQAPIRALPSQRYKDHYSPYYNKNPLDILGEKSFVKLDKTPVHVVGSRIQEFYRDTHILITGGTGFLGKVLTEKLVRTIPHMGHIYLLIRTKRGKDPQERFEKLLEDKVFRRMREEVPWYRSKLTAVAGDLHQSGLGLSGADRKLLTDQVHVVFHSAADVKFTEPLKVAIESNVSGTRRVMDLATQMTRLKACVHVSTAYSQCVRRVIPESVPRMSIPYQDILKYIDTHDDDTKDPEIVRLMQGWPNSYTFSKALCEIMLEEEYRTLPLSIFRPSVIVPTYKEPFRGWTDNFYGPAALMVAAGMGVLHCSLIDEELSLDMVPADLVINALISTGRETGSNRISGNVKVYNYTTHSPQRYWSWKHIMMVGTDSTICWPFNNTVWFVSYQQHTSRLMFEFKHFVLHKTPAWIVDKLLLLTGRRPRLMKACQIMDELQPSSEYFLFTCFEFKNDNIKNLWDSMEKEDKSLFSFDTSGYDILANAISSTLGVKYYLFKEDMDSLPGARRRYQWLYWAHTSVKTVFWFGVLSLSARLARVLPL